jgi:methionyl-tRNA formyltransferase
MKIAYFGYDFFSGCLSSLLNQGHQVLCVFSFETDDKYNFNRQVLRQASQHGVPVKLHKVTSRDIEELRDKGCDLFVSAAYPYRIPINSNCDRGINIHPTLLPEGKGPWPLPYIILKDLKESGVTIHKLREQFDSGEILLQKSFQIIPQETLESLSFKCHLAAVNLLEQFMSDFDSIWQNARSQQGGSYWHFPTDEEQTIDWGNSVSDIDRLVRAYGKLHSTAKFDNETWLVSDATVWKEKHDFTPGTVILRSNKEVLIAAKDGYVALRHFEREEITS